MTAREHRGGGNRIIGGGGGESKTVFWGGGFMVCFPSPEFSNPPLFFSEMSDKL